MKKGILALILVSILILVGLCLLEEHKHPGAFAIKKAIYLNCFGNHEGSQKILDELYGTATMGKNDEIFKLIFNDRKYASKFENLVGRNKLKMNQLDEAKTSFSMCARRQSPYCIEGLGEVFYLQGNTAAADMYFREAKESSKTIIDKMKISWLIKKTVKK